MIKEFRKRHNMSQVKLSELSGVSRSYIGELENNKYKKATKRLNNYTDLWLFTILKKGK